MQYDILPSDTKSRPALIASTHVISVARAASGPVAIRVWPSLSAAMSWFVEATGEGMAAWVAGLYPGLHFPADEEAWYAAAATAEDGWPDWELFPEDSSAGQESSRDSDPLSRPDADAPAEPRRWAPFTAWLVKPWSAFRHWLGSGWEAGSLTGLSDHMLRDIGLTREQTGDKHHRR